ncbi:Prephenate dehydratase-domain-containing protein [Phaeosphaeriaceae sp. PMI808]|nr:Prephenate dehydratase-domain-containing protein [Phaeosphaeriaceae sp. PMI808]
MTDDERPVVAFLGPEASYTHQAALNSFNKKDVKLSPQTTIADVFTAVQNGTAYRGVVPFENSSNGSVLFTLDLISDLHSMHPDILVCGESYIAVKHCLLGHVSPSPSTAPAPTKHVEIDKKFTTLLASPTSDLSKIKKLYSHPQAWGQCKAFLAAYLKGIERHDVSSTSRAAELVASDPSGESAALSSEMAADMFGLDILASSINDRIGNTTRFLVLCNRHKSTPNHNLEPSLSSSVADTSGDSDSDDAWKTLVIFTVNHANPGALAHGLAVFERWGLNLTSINTRPSGVENWNYIFFVEFMGRREGGERDV